MTPTNERRFKKAHEIVGWTMSGCVFIVGGDLALSLLENWLGMSITPWNYSVFIYPVVGFWILLLILSLGLALIRIPVERDLAILLLWLNLPCPIIIPMAIGF